MPQIEKLNQQLNDLGAEDRLIEITKHFKKIALATSFGKEDQVLTDMIYRLKLGIDLFTLDTGRLFSETYQTWQKTKQFYDLKIKTFAPNATQLQSFIEQKGPNSFYLSKQNRIECCRIRKVEGLKKALKNYDCWIVGLRAAQSDLRANTPVLMQDKQFSLAKLSPLVDWSDQKIDTYSKKYQLILNPLHKQGFVSIGCAPCTRAIEKGMDFRAGRWWWEKSSKECGLHENYFKKT